MVYMLEKAILLSLCACLSLTQTVAAARYHEQHRNLQARQRHGMEDLNGIVPASASQITAGSAAIEDIQNIQEGISDLPENLLNFVEEAQSRLQQLESLLASLTSPRPTSTSSFLPLASGSAPLIPYETPPPYPTPHNGSYPGTGYTASPTATGHSYPTPYASPTSSDAYDSQATNNVAVHHTIFAVNDNISLSDLCDDPNINIVVLDFLFTFANLTEGWPDMWYGPECSGSYVARQQGHSLFDCSALAPQIQGCQRSGKKVLLGLGQAVPSTNFTVEQAELLAQQMWALFARRNSADDGPRPIADDVAVDGFEITLNIYDSTLPWDVFAETVRSLSYQDWDKQYVIASRPSCDVDNPGIVPGAMAISNFIWPQFHSDSSCQVDLTDDSEYSEFGPSSAYALSFRKWFAFVNEYYSPQLYIGLSASQEDAAFTPSDRLIGFMPQMWRGPPPKWPLRLRERLGGVAVQDGAEAITNVDSYNATWLDWLKAAFGETRFWERLFKPVVSSISG